MQRPCRRDALLFEQEAIQSRELSGQYRSIRLLNCGKNSSDCFQLTNE